MRLLLLALAPSLSPPVLAGPIQVEAAGGAGGAADEPTWADLELPEGLRLELATGEVTSRAVDPVLGALTLVDGRLVAEPPLRALGPGGERFAPADGEVRAPGVPEVGEAFAFSLDGGTWGLVRVLGVAQDAVRLEYARAPAGADELVRSPATLAVGSADGLLELSWHAPDDARHVVIRRVVGRDDEERFEVAGGAWTDPRPPGTDLLEYRVRRVGAALGARALGHRGATGGSVELEIARGARIDLLAGELGGRRADLEVIYLNPPSIALRPLGGASVESLAPGAWTAPAPGPGRYPADRVRTTDLGVELAVRLPESIYARLSFRRDEAGAIHLRRTLALDGSRRFPVPPGPPAATWTADGLRLVFPPLETAPDPDRVVVVAERELEPDGGDWRAVEESRPGSRALLLEAGPRSPDLPPLVSYRFRHRVPGGRVSPPSAPTVFLRGDRGDPDQVAAWLDRAFANLTNDEFEARLAARRMIEALADEAFPRLEAALLDRDPEVSLAARELLGALPGAEGLRIGLLLRSQASRMGRTGAAAELPPGLGDPDPIRRARALLAHWRDAPDTPDTPDAPAGEGAATWLQVVERADPDATLVRFAELLGRLPAPAEADGRPAVETPPYARILPAAVDVELVDELDADLLARHVERAVDVHAPDEAWVLLALLDRLARAEDDATVLEDARLVLRLLARWRTSGDESLLLAARSLAGDPAGRLAAWRALLARRARSAPSPVERRRVRLEQATWTALVASLAELEAEGATYVDVVLPAGEYALDDGASATGTLLLGVPGLRLVGEGEVVLRGALQVSEAVDVILENLAIEHPGGTPLYARNAEVHVRGGRLVGYQTAIQASQSRVELEDVFVGIPDQSGRSRWAARLSDGGELWARGCLFAAGTIATGPAASVYLEGCVLSAGGQTAIQGQRGDRIVVRDSLLVGEGIGISGVERGLLVGVLLDFARDAVARGSDGVRLSPTLAWTGARTPPLDAKLFLPTCPLAATRR